MEHELQTAIEYSSPMNNERKPVIAFKTVNDRLHRTRLVIRKIDIYFPEIKEFAFTIETETIKHYTKR